MGSKKKTKVKSEFEIIRDAVEEGLPAIRRDNVRRFDVELPEPAPKLAGKAIAELRSRFAYSQAVFASVLNVSVKTVQAWEQGTRNPDGAALRLLEIMSQKPELFTLESPKGGRGKGRRSTVGKRIQRKHAKV